MTIQESRVAFSKEVKEESEKHLQAAQAYIAKHYDALVEAFLTDFRKYCVKIMKYQQHGGKKPLAYLQFSMMRTRLIHGIYQFRMDTYDETWYEDTNICASRYVVSPIFAYLEKFKVALTAALTERRKPYMNRILIGRVKQYVQRESDLYKGLVTELIRSALPKAVKLPEYKAILRADVFVITVGDYYDEQVIVHKEDRTEKVVEDVVKSLSKQENHGVQYEIFDGVTFRNVPFSHVRWVYCSGKESTFIGSTVSYSMLFFCQFQGAHFEAVNFNDCDLVGVDFSGATLTNIDVTGANLAQVNFSGATLTNIDFTKAKTCVGVNFDEATLEDVRLPDAREVVK